MGRLLTLLNPYRFAAAGGGGGGSCDAVGITTLPSTASNSFNNEYGWQFTVGASDITVCKLRVNLASNNNEVVNLWRVSDEALLASEAISAVNGSWVEATLASTVTLAASTKYVVSTEPADGLERNISFSATDSFVFNSAITHDGRVRGNGGVFPGDELTAGAIAGIPDIVFSI